MLRLPRRVLLRALLLEGTAGIIAASGLPACVSEKEAESSDAARLSVLSGYFDGRLAEAARIGRVSLSNDALQAAGHLEALERSAEIIASARDPGPALAELDARVEAELAKGDVVEVAGWILSPTEVALCILAARQLDG